MRPWRLRPLLLLPLRQSERQQAAGVGRLIGLGIHRDGSCPAGDGRLGLLLLVGAGFGFLLLSLFLLFVVVLVLVAGDRRLRRLDDERTASSERRRASGHSIGPRRSWNRDRGDGLRGNRLDDAGEGGVAQPHDLEVELLHELVGRGRGKGGHRDQKVQRADHIAVHRAGNLPSPVEHAGILHGRLWRDVRQARQDGVEAERMVAEQALGLVVHGEEADEEMGGGVCHAERGRDGATLLLYEEQLGAPVNLGSVGRRHRGRVPSGSGCHYPQFWRRCNLQIRD